MPAGHQARGHFPTEHAALKRLHQVTRSLDPAGTGRSRWAMRWKPALNAFATNFGDRLRPPGLLRTAGNTVSEIDPACPPPLPAPRGTLKPEELSEGPCG